MPWALAAQLTARSTLGGCFYEKEEYAIWFLEEASCDNKIAVEIAII